MAVKMAILMKIKNGSMKSVINSLKEIPEVTKILSITGDYDILLDIEVEKPEQLQIIYLKKIDHIPGIIEIHSQFVLSEWEK